MTEDQDVEHEKKSWLEQNRWAGLLLLVALILAVTQGPKILNGLGGSGEDEAARVDLVASYTIQIDESRAVQIDVDGWFAPTSSVEEADPGKTDVGLRSKGDVKFTNLSEDRKIRSRDEVLEHDLVLQVPRDICLLDEGRAEILSNDEFQDSNCQATILHIEPRLLILDGGESKSQSFSEFLDFSAVGPDGVNEPFGSLPESDAGQWTGFASSPSAAVVVAGADNRSKLVNGLNPECEIPLKDGTTATNVTFWSSMKGIDYCW